MVSLKEALKRAAESTAALPKWVKEIFKRNRHIEVATGHYLPESPEYCSDHQVPLQSEVVKWCPQCLQEMDEAEEQEQLKFKKLRKEARREERNARNFAIRREEMEKAYYEDDPVVNHLRQIKESQMNKWEEEQRAILSQLSEEDWKRIIKRYNKD